MSKTEQATWIGWVKGLIGVVLFAASVGGLYTASEMKHQASTIDRAALHKEMTQHVSLSNVAMTQIHKILLGEIQRLDSRGSVPMQDIQIDVAKLKGDVEYIKKGQDDLKETQKRSIERITEQMDRIEDKLP